MVNVLDIPTLRKVCPVKWHDQIPPEGISLGIADIDFDGPSGVFDYIKEKLDWSYSFYQSQIGLPEAIDAASRYMKSKGIPAQEDDIQIIEGTMIGIHIIMRWIAQKKGQIIMLGPIYEPIHRHATDTGNKLSWIDISQEQYTEQLKDRVTNDTKMIGLCNPSNPNGHNYGMKELKLIRDLAQDYDLYVFSDELYEPLTFDKHHTSIASLPEMYDKSVLLYGFSKAYGLAGFRSGFMYLGGEQEDLHNRANSLMVSPSPMASLVCEYALTATEVKHWVSEFRGQVQKTTRFAAQKFKQNGYNCQIPSGCFFIFPDIKVEDMEFETFALEKYGVQVIAGSKFGPMGKGHIRINCATSIDRLDRGIDLVLQALDDFNV